MRVVGLSGKRFSGKDTFAALLSKHAAARGLVLRTYAFAAESKRMFVEKRRTEGVAIDGERLLSDRAYKEQLRPELTRFTVESIAADPLVFCRSVADRIARASDLELPLITDVRLTLEVEHLRSRFELHLARLLRSDARRADSGWRFTPDVDGHHTETELDDPTWWNEQVNNDGTIEELDTRARAFLEACTMGS